MISLVRSPCVVRCLSSLLGTKIKHRSHTRALARTFSARQCFEVVNKHDTLRPLYKHMAIILRHDHHKEAKKYRSHTCALARTFFVVLGTNSKQTQRFVISLQAPGHHPGTRPRNHNRGQRQPSDRPRETTWCNNSRDFAYLLQGRKKWLVSAAGGKRNLFKKTG